MPNSLKCKLSSLRYKRLLTDEEYQEIIKKMNGHDREIRNKAIDDFAEKIIDLVNEFPTVEDDFGEIRPMRIEEMCNVLAEQLKGEKQ